MADWIVRFMVTLTLGGQQVGLAMRVTHLVDGCIRLKGLVNGALATAHDHSQRRWVGDEHHVVPQELKAVDASKPAASRCAESVGVLGCIRCGVAFIVARQGRSDIAGGSN